MRKKGTGKNSIAEYLMTESSPGEGFTKIVKQPSIISDLLKELSIEINDLCEDMILPLGETEYFIFYDYTAVDVSIYKVYLINKKRKCVESIIISNLKWHPVVNQCNPSIFYLFQQYNDKPIEFDLFS